MLHKVFEGTEQEFERYRKNSRLSPNMRIVVIEDDEKTKHPQLDALIDEFQTFGGLTSAEAKELEKHTKEFRENFEI